MGVPCSQWPHGNTPGRGPRALQAQPTAGAAWREARLTPWLRCSRPFSAVGLENHAFLLPAGYFIDEVSCGMHHCVALGRPADRKTGRPAADPAPRVVFAWGRGSEGQLGVKGFEDSPAPVLVDSLKGRQVLQVRQQPVVRRGSRWQEPARDQESSAYAWLLARAGRLAWPIFERTGLRRSCPCRTCSGHLRRQQQHGGVRTQHIALGAGQ